MGWLTKLFKKKDGGTFVGNAWRSLLGVKRKGNVNYGGGMEEPSTEPMEEPTSEPNPSQQPNILQTVITGISGLFGSAKRAIDKGVNVNTSVETGSIAKLGIVVIIVVLLISFMKKKKYL